jgi:integrase
LVGLRWGDVDLERGVLRVGRRRTKTAAGARTLRLPAVVEAALRTHRARQNQRRLRAGDRWRDGGFVFDRGDGRSMSPKSVGDAFRRSVRRAGLPHIRLHDLRHGFASLLSRAGIPVKTMSIMLGHANVGITLDLYTHLELADQAAAAVDAALTEPEARDQDRDRGLAAAGERGAGTGAGG